MNKQILAHYGIDHQLEKLKEELIERIETVNKIQAEGWTLENIIHFLEELADVENMNEQMLVYINENKLFINPEASVFIQKITKQLRTFERIK